MHVNEEKQVEQGIADMLGAIFDPMIVYPGGWGEDMPEWIHKNMSLARLVENMKALKEHRPVTATDLEACMYLFTASLTAPMHEPWVTIYKYVFTKTMREWMNIKEIPDGLGVDSLDDAAMRELAGLKDFIYQTRVKHRKGQLSSSKEDINPKTGEREVVKTGEKRAAPEQLMDRFPGLG